METSAVYHVGRGLVIFLPLNMARALRLTAGDRVSWEISTDLWTHENIATVRRATSQPLTEEPCTKPQSDSTS